MRLSGCSSAILGFSIINIFDAHFYDLSLELTDLCIDNRDRLTEPNQNPGLRILSTKLIKIIVIKTLNAKGSIKVHIGFL